MKKFNEFITEIIDNTAKNYSYNPDEYSPKEYIDMFKEFKSEISDSINIKIGTLKFEKRKNSKGEIIFLIPKIELIYNFNKKNTAEEQNILDQKVIKHYENINEALEQFRGENPLEVNIKVKDQLDSNLFNFIIALEGKEKENRIRIEGGVNFQDFLDTISQIHQTLEIEVMEYNEY
jgi:hypothetical protein